MGDGHTQQGIQLDASGSPMAAGRQAGIEELERARNYFLKLLPDALLEEKRLMKMSSNEKLRHEIASEIIERAGAGVGPKSAPVVINDSQVQILLHVAREVLDG